MNKMPSVSRRHAMAALGGAVALAASPRLFAQGARPLTWLVGQPAGGSVDILTRLVARHVEQALGQPVVVDNRPGAAGAIALQAAARAPHDGLTVVTIPGPILTSMPVPRIGKELTGVATLAKGPMVLVGTTASPMPPTLAALLAAGKDPKAFSFASSGNGTSQHLAGELMNQIAGTRIVHVPYKGGSQAVTDVVGGQVQLGMLGITPVLPHIKSGKLHAYGVTTATRSPALPDVPTLREAGLPGFDADQWFVVAAPAGVPAERVRALNAAIAQALQKPEVQSGYAAAGVTPAPATAEQTTAFVVQELQRWQTLAKKADLPLD
ncbi:tripartite tricarboxylate transporter substrate-binding protein [Variovorax sp. 375MFSha3.1]|uniref:Tripartite tricarboxylate transporter substrate binding protein n=1 Tax=Variovorax guangxiensis TaxID=1775474 RepID=A0A433ME64_9BURK|nr:tripartite tricarboxylate transporter substrate-binding protein [Variovorax guangxiensis]RUR66020.1 tripartite tricarboxylate transporter substrate binding protein [Variovorax guangxiensis]